MLVYGRRARRCFGADAISELCGMQDFSRAPRFPRILDLARMTAGFVSVQCSLETVEGPIVAKRFEGVPDVYFLRQAENIWTHCAAESTF